MMRKTSAMFGIFVALLTTFFVVQVSEITVFADTKTTLTVADTQISNKMYDGTTVASVECGTLQGQANEDDVAIDTCTAVFSDKNVGVDKQVTITYTLKGADAEKYTVEPEIQTAGITPRPLEVSGTELICERVYIPGDNTVTVTEKGALGNIVNGEDVFLDTVTAYFENGAEIGDGKAITIQYTIGGADALNYSVPPDSGTSGNIKAAPVFDDRLGGRVSYDGGDDFIIYTAYTTDDNPYKDTKGYDFAGWYDAQGELLEGEPELAVSYTARWTREGKTVILESLDFNGSEPEFPVDSGITWVSGTKTLTLDGATVDVCTGNGPQNGLCLPEGAKIVLIGENRISSTYSGTGENIFCGISAVGTLEISGTGSLVVDALDSGNHARGIVTGNDLIVTGADVTVSGTDRSLFIGRELIIETDGRIMANASIEAGSPIGNRTDRFYTAEGTYDETDGTVRMLTPYISEEGAEPETIVLTLTEYTVTFDGLMGEEAQQMTTGYITRPVEKPVKEGHKFINWGMDEDAAYAYAYNFELSYIRSDMTLYPIWVKASTVLTDCTGYVKDQGGSPLVNADVVLFGVNGLIGDTASDADGKFTLENLPKGVYNLGIWDFTAGNMIITTFHVPDDSGKTFIIQPDVTTVTIKTGERSMFVVVDGIDTLAKTQKEAESGLSLDVYCGDEYENFDDEQQAAIRRLSGRQILEYYEFNVQKSIDGGGNYTDLTDIGNDVLTFIVPYDTNRNGIAVYRYHGTGAEAFMQETQAMDVPVDGRFYVDTENGLIYIYASKFSIYAIGYDRSSGGGGSGKKTIEESTEPTSENFIDVETDDYCYDAVLWAVEKGVTCGADETHFAPNTVATRAQIMTFLWRAAGSPEPAADACGFADVKKDTYYEKAVLWAAENGITKGISVGEFGVEDAVTRGQVAMFMARMAGMTAADIAHVYQFKDVDPAKYYSDAIAWAAENGVMLGTGPEMFSPEEKCTRGEIAMVLYRYFVQK